MNYDSAKNQEIKGRFVAREVFACFSYEMDSVLKAEGGDLPTYEDIENLYYTYEQAKDYGMIDDEVSEDDYDPEPQEIYEWWIVSEYLYRKLKEKGEPVLEWGNNYYWGRTCMGQAIKMDNVIGEICEEMEILEGQKYEWK